MYTYSSQYFNHRVTTFPLLNKWLVRQLGVWTVFLFGGFVLRKFVQSKAFQLRLLLWQFSVLLEHCCDINAVQTNLNIEISVYGQYVLSIQPCLGWPCLGRQRRVKSQIFLFIASLCCSMFSVFFGKSDANAGVWVVQDIVGMLVKDFIIPMLW